MKKTFVKSWVNVVGKPNCTCYTECDLIGEANTDTWGLGLEVSIDRNPLGMRGWMFSFIIRFLCFTFSVQIDYMKDEDGIIGDQTHDII